MKTKQKVKTLTMEEIIDLSREYGVPASRVMCGYLRAPRELNGDTMTGYCSLFDKQCTYQVPLIKCEAEEEWLQKKHLDFYKKK